MLYFEFRGFKQAKSGNRRNLHRFVRLDLEKLLFGDNPVCLLRESGTVGRKASKREELFFLDEDGNLAVAHVETGITDGQSTVITGPQIAEGMQIVAAITTGTAAAASNAAASNPFQSQSGNRPSGGPQR